MFLISIANQSCFITNATTTTHKKNKQPTRPIPKTSFIHNLCYCCHNFHKLDPNEVNDKRQNIIWFSTFKLKQGFPFHIESPKTIIRYNSKL